MVAQPTIGIVPGLQRILVPLSDSPLGSVNVYLIESDDGPILIDTGWRTDEVVGAIEAGLAAVGATTADLSQIVLTHAHPDHAGLASTFREASNAPIALHAADWQMVDPVRRQDEANLARSAAWFRRNGLPDRDSGDARGARRSMGERNPPFVPDRALVDGESLQLGRFNFRVIWVPGHARGQVCLYDEREGVLISADHVLPEISPNVGLYGPDDGQPLDDYLASLAKVRDLPVTVALPGHGEPFTGLAERVDWLAEHHEERMDEIRAALGDAPATAFDLCHDLTWIGGTVHFSKLSPFQQSMATAETIAHLEVLRRRDEATSEDDGERITWRKVG
jgi:glyoxylase-like metal-dependent hydrolase (beta-lactamase superfamily II)